MSIVKEFATVNGIENTTANRLYYKDKRNSESLDSIVSYEAPVNIGHVKGWMIIESTNDKGQDYEIIVIITDEGSYYTGSQSFMTSFYDISSELEIEDYNEIEFVVCKYASKKYDGKYYLSCSVNIG